MVFFATPHGVAMAQAPELLAAGVKVIDLAADFRLKDTAVFEKWYGMPHACPELLEEAVYGLPEVNREAISKARADRPSRAAIRPRCSSALLPCCARQGPGRHERADRRLQVGRVGRRPQGRSRHAVCRRRRDNFKAYGVKGHRHLPETVAGLASDCRPPGRPDLRAAPGADDTRHPFDAVCDASCRKRATPISRRCMKTHYPG